MIQHQTNKKIIPTPQPCKARLEIGSRAESPCGVWGETPRSFLFCLYPYIYWYTFRYAKKKHSATTIEQTSATGIESQIPSISKKCGSTSMLPTTNTNVRRNEIAADTFPFDNAVKNDDAKILTPANRKFHINIRYPSRAMAKVLLSCGVKIAIAGTAIM